MPRLPLLALALLATVAVAACSSASAPGWTYAPAPSVTPAPSGSGSADPSASASASPSGGASASPGASASASAGPSESPSGSGGATVLTITAPQGAATTGFDPKDLEGPANTPFTVTFDNQDTTTSPHNWVLKDPAGTNVPIGDTAFFSGPAARDFQIPALAAGAYPFVCDVHVSTMTGTLTIK